MQRKKIYLAIVLVILLSSQSYLYDIFSPSSGELEENNIPVGDTKNVISDLQSEDLEIVGNPQTSDSFENEIVDVPEIDQADTISDEVWYPGQTVRVDYDPHNNYISEIVDYTAPINTESGGLTITYLSDNIYHTLNTLEGSPIDTLLLSSPQTVTSDPTYDFSVVFKIPAKTSGTLRLEGYGQYDSDDIPDNH